MEGGSGEEREKECKGKKSREKKQIIEEKGTVIYQPDCDTITNTLTVGNLSIPDGRISHVHCK